MKCRVSMLLGSALLFGATLPGAVLAQGMEVKEKPALYTYESSWEIPRAKWADMDKGELATIKVLDKALADGTIVVYGNETTRVHTAGGSTHDTWWEASSMAGLMSVLEQLSRGGQSTTAVLAGATRHADQVFVTHYYNWKSGSFKDGIAKSASYQLKDSAPGDALDTLAKTALVPLFEKLLADGAILGYEIDEEAIHTSAPGKFWTYFVTRSADGLDKVNAALQASVKSNPLIGSAFDSFVDFKEHRDSISSINGAAK
ncbi:MAG: hypothetical protein U1F35_12120 [Steroidobacteraceae bacterium]